MDGAAGKCLLLSYSQNLCTVGEVLVEDINIGVVGMKAVVAFMRFDVTPLSERLDSLLQKDQRGGQKKELWMVWEPTLQGSGGKGVPSRSCVLSYMRSGTCKSRC